MPNWWPFGRRRKRNRSTKDHDASEKLTRDSPHDPLFDEKRDASSPTYQSRDNAQISSHPPRLRTPLVDDDPFSPPHSNPRTAQTSGYPTENASVEEITALPITRRATTPPRVKSSEGYGSSKSLVFQNLTEALAAGPRPTPSLYSKRSATHDGQPSRKKSSKKKREQTIRESQIKAMSSPIPIPKRYGADSRIRAALNEGSAVSLPRAPSARSSITALSDNQYEVGGIDVFSPRPTIRYSVYNNPNTTTASRTVSRTEDRYDKDISPRKALKESKTIDDLADEYDAHTLRDLMERDKRRRERRRKANEERARRRLEKYVEAGEPGPSVGLSQERETSTEAGLGLVGFEPGPSRLRIPADNVAVKETEDLSGTVPSRNPFADHESEIITPVEDPLVSTAEEVRYSQISASPPASPTHTRNRSYTTDPRSTSVTNVSQPPADLDRRASETGASKRTGPLSSIFRRSALGRRTSGDAQNILPAESSFSNTSRESMSRQLPPSHLRDYQTVPRVRSGTPTRTMSKFREDLPELPPATALPAVSSTLEPGPLDATAATTLSARQQEKMPDTRASGEELLDSQTESPSVALLSQSMASVDSEGSWLSGRPPKRTSLQSSVLGPDGRTSRGQQSKEKIDPSENPYFGRLEPATPQQGAGGISAALIDEQAQGGQSETVGRVGEIGRRPTVIQQQGRAKSNEGLLKEFKDGEVVSTAASPVEAKSEAAESGDSSSSQSPSKPTFALAHTRSVSRGSAKLLDITRKDSGREKATTPPPPRAEE